MTTDNTGENEGRAATGRWILLAAILASAMAFIDGSALNVALPALQADLNATGVELLWIVNGYLLMLASFILIGGALGDRLGRKRVFMSGIGVFLLGSLASGLAPDTTFLIGARVVQGIGGAVMIPGSLSLISSHFRAKTRGQAIGTWSAASTIVTVGGPVLGGFLADVGLWRAVFLINLPLGLVSLAALHLRVLESRDEKTTGPPDYAGAALIVLGLAGLSYGFISAPERGFGNPYVYGALVAGTVLLASWVLVESASKNPMVPMRLFRSRTFTGGNLLTLCLYGGLNAGMFFLALNLVQIQGYRQVLAGLAFLPFGLILAGMSRWAGGQASTHSPRLFLVAGPTCAGLGFLAMSFVGLSEGPPAYWTTFFPGIVLFGIGMGLTVAPLTTAVMGAVPTHNAGTASGINNAIARTAGVLAIAVVGSLALLTFATALENRTSAVGLSPEARTALRAEANRLGEAQVPEMVAEKDEDAVGRAIKLSFVDAFRLVMYICTGMSWLSALAAAFLVEKDFAAAS